ncbi:MAG TPA: HEAT repeat domain-containing protein, partial [Actinomycetota bacterium]|nr:HEAT repeat domain-containing protein [Actinomycetota bacterium]
MTAPAQPPRSGGPQGPWPPLPTADPEAPILRAVGHAFRAPHASGPGPLPTGTGGGAGAGGEVASASPYRALLEDPDPERRAEAARALEWAPLSVLRAVLQDPDDRVRAAAVPLAVPHGRAGLRLLLPLLGDRAFPLAQARALATLPELLGRADPVQPEEVLAAVGRLDPPPLPVEWEPLRAVARALGRDRLLGALRGPEAVRSGAARLLLVEGSPAALRTLAGLDLDSSPEVRRCAALARWQGQGPWMGELRTGDPWPGAPPSGEPPSGEPWLGERWPEAEPPTEELLASLARALTDPSPGVRAGAAEALQSLPEEAVLGWARRALRSAAGPDATAAAAAVGVLGLAGASRELLERAADTDPADRGPYLEALRSLHLDGPELRRLVASVDSFRRPESLWVVWQVAGSRFLGELPSFLQDPLGAARATALEVLLEAGAPAALRQARRLLEEDPSPVVRAGAARALVAAGGAEALAALAAALTDP